MYTAKANKEELFRGSAYFLASRVLQPVERAVPHEVAPPIRQAVSAMKTLPIQVRFLVLALAGWRVAFPN